MCIYYFYFLATFLFIITAAYNNSTTFRVVYSPAFFRFLSKIEHFNSLSRAFITYKPFSNFKTIFLSLSLSVFGLLSSSLLLFPQRFYRYGGLKSVKTENGEIHWLKSVKTKNGEIHWLKSVKTENGEIHWLKSVKTENGEIHRIEKCINWKWRNTLIEKCKNWKWRNTQDWKV